jgi:hypothetical protein
MTVGEPTANPAMPDSLAQSAGWRSGLWTLGALIVLSFVLQWGTGLASDDYVHIWQALDWRLADHWWPDEYASIPVLHYTQGLVFFLLGDRPWAYDLVKALYTAAAVYGVSRFFALFCSPNRALVFGFLFVFFPLHDSADYSLTMFYILESFAFYLYAYALGARGRFGLAVVFALLASFASYGSSPVAFGLALLAYLQQQRKLALAMIVPNLIYVAYYLISSLLFKVGTPRLIGEMTIPALIKGFILEIVTFADATFGPSAWAKFFYSITALDALGIVIALAAAAGAVICLVKEPRVAPASTTTRNLLLSCAVIVVLSFGMFSLTGLYPFIAFNLGDRIMVYGSFLLVCALVTLRLPRIAEQVAVVVTIFAIAGLSVHWKDWNREIERVAANIRASQALRAVPSGAMVFVSHDQFSRLGPFAHIELFNPTYVVRAFFNLQMRPAPFDAVSFNRRYELRNDGLRDMKFGDTLPVGDVIWLYNARENTLERVSRADIPARLGALPDENRHWVQMIENPWIKDLMGRVVPRLRYAF